MAMKMVYFVVMKVANIAEFKNNLSEILALVAHGEVVEIRKRNVPVAHLVPIDSKERCNRTELGCGRESVQVKTDLTEPLIPSGRVSYRSG